MTSTSALPAAMAAADPFAVTFVIVTILVAVGFYATEKTPIETISLGVIAAFLLFFTIYPVELTEGGTFSASRIVAGFGNEALITIAALLVVGQALFQTGALNAPTAWLVKMSGAPNRAFMLLFIATILTSAVLNNTPVVVMFIPVIVSLAEKLKNPAPHALMALSFVAILGGMTTVIGSSTNLLAAQMAHRVDRELTIGFFDFVLPGAVLCAVGVVYCALVLPRLVGGRAAAAGALSGARGKQFIGQIDVQGDHPLRGKTPVAGMFPQLPGVTVRLIQRGEHAFLPPFDDVVVEAGDVVIVAATRKALDEILASTPRMLISSEVGATGGERSEIVLTEAVVTPGSRMIGRNLEQIALRLHTGFIVVGVQRRSRMIRARMSDIRLEEGDVLLLTGPRERLNELREGRDVLVTEASITELPDLDAAHRARLIFLGVVGVAASGVAPILTAAVCGAFAMVVSGCLNIRQAARSVDRRILLIVASALAMGDALRATGGADIMAHSVAYLFEGYQPHVILSAFFLMVAIITNILSNNATAVLFTPIGIELAMELGVDPRAFVYAVIFAANCSFATPMGYQTNLLVMGPGHYRFKDFLKGGGPLILIVWAAFTLCAPVFFALGTSTP